MVSDDPYGFSEEDPHEQVQLPTRPKKNAKVDREIVNRIAETGESLGFVDRDPTSPPKLLRKPGRKKGAPRGSIAVTGPAEIINRFKIYCEARNLTYAEAIDDFLRLVDSHDHFV